MTELGAEVRHSPTPRFSDEAKIAAANGIHGVRLRDGDIIFGSGVTGWEVDLAEAALHAPEVEAEFDAACLSAWRSGQETAGRGLTRRLLDRLSIERPTDFPFAGKNRLCSDDEEHDNRWCPTCSAMADGLRLAADLIEQWSKEGSDD